MKKIYSFLFGCIAVLDTHIVCAGSSDSILLEPRYVQEKIDKFFTISAPSLWVDTFGSMPDYIESIFNQVIVMAISDFNDCIKNDTNSLVNSRCVTDFCKGVFSVAIEAGLNKERINENTARNYCKAFATELLSYYGVEHPAPNVYVDQVVVAPVETPYNPPVETPYNPPVETPYNTPVETPYNTPVETPNADTSNNLSSQPHQTMPSSQGDEIWYGTPKSMITQWYEDENIAVPRSCHNWGGISAVENGTYVKCNLHNRDGYRVKYLDAKKIHFKGNINWRNNNPGNLRKSPFECGRVCVAGSGGFSVFATEEDGWEAMRWLLTNENIKGLTRGPYALLNIADAIAQYAPTADNNNPERYAQRVKAEMRRQGVKRADLDTVLLKNLTANELEIMMHAMMGVEGGATGTVEHL